MKKYQIIYADPPWQFQAGGGRKPPYPVMKMKDIIKLPINDLSDENCILFLWATDPQLPDAIQLIKEWGFKYKTVAWTWVKTGKVAKFSMGLGYWTRGNPEMCLLATKGKIHRLAKNIPQLLLSPRREHSRKPDEIKDKIISLVGDLTRIELFAREKTEGWDVWGNEVKNDIEL